MTRFARLLLPALALVASAFVALPAQAQSDWSTCAAEGGQCRINGRALVRFGVPGHYSFRAVHEDVRCDTETFGDPAPNQAKQCQASYAWRSDPRYGGWREAGGDAGDRWRQCADEGGVCRLSGPARVRYGANGRYEYRQVTNSIACTNRVFGDPIPDVAKQCDVRSDDAPAALVWELCAREGARCELSGPAMVRYGVDRRHVYRELRRSFDCGNERFGVDPAPGVTKRCETLRLGR